MELEPQVAPVVLAELDDLAIGEGVEDAPDDLASKIALALLIDSY